MARKVSRQCRNRSDEGFTLIELMVVVTIISILGAVAIPKYISYVRSSQAAEVGNMGGIIVSTIRSYADAQGLTAAAVKSTFDNSYLIVNGVDTAPGAGTNLTTTIPQLALPPSSSFTYLISSAVSTDNGTDAQFCVTAYGRTAAGITNSAPVLYSSMPAKSSNTAGWEGRMWKLSYTSAGSTAPSAGGYCGTTGAIAGSAYPATATQQ